MDMRQAWCLGFSVAITLAAIGSIATLTGGSLEAVMAADLDGEGQVASEGAVSTFSPVIELPAVLQAGATTNLVVGLIGIDADTPRGTQPMVQVELALELVPAARGWIQLPRARHLLAAEDLQRRSFALQVAPAAPCGTIPGRITVTVTAADGQGHTGQVRRLLPPIACDQLPPAAPASLHAPAGSCSDFDDDRPLAAAVVEPAGCGEPVRRPAQPSDTRPPERPDEDEDEATDEATEQDADADDGDDGPDDDAQDRPDPSDGPTDDEAADPGDGNGAGDDRDSSNGGDTGGDESEDGAASTSGSQDGDDRDEDDGDRDRS
jgi:hypothetical protein